MDQALPTLEVFASVGATGFCLTFTDIDGSMREHRPTQRIDPLKRALPYLMRRAAGRQWNVIIRPHASVTLVQLDDLNAEKLARVQSEAFLTLETSPGNFQAWVAISSARTDTASRLKRGVGADPGASGASRLPGSRNYKRRYEPHFPTVALIDSAPGRIVTPERLRDMGLLAEPIRHTWIQRVQQTAPRRWPSYQMCLDRGPPNQSKTGVDRSRVDMAWAIIAADWGWQEDEIAARLMQVSDKAKLEGERYCVLTAKKAVTIAFQRNPQADSRSISRLV